MLSTNPPKNQAVPTDQVKDDLPNAVSAGYWMSCRVFRRNTRQHFAHRRPMPGLAAKGSADLICEDLQIQGIVSPIQKVGLTLGISCETRLNDARPTVPVSAKRLRVSTASCPCYAAVGYPRLAFPDRPVERQATNVPTATPRRVFAVRSWELS